LKNNLGEVIIPQNLLGGNLTFYLNDKEYFPKVNTNEKISFVTLNFTGSGNNQLEIIGTTHFFGLSEETETPQSNLVSPTDYDLIYTIVMVLLIVGVIAGVIIFKLKQGRK